MALLSIVIPCRNAAAELGGQLSALVRQCYENPWEVIVCDNGSTDDTRDVAARFVQDLPIRVVDSGARAGRAYACNVGVEAAEGNRILFLDADDEVAPGYLTAMSCGLEHSDAVAARLDPDKLNPSWLISTRGRGQYDDLLRVLGFLPFGLGCSLGVTRSAFYEVHGFDEDVPYAEDVDLCWRLQLAGRTLAFVPEAMLHHRYRQRVDQLYRQTRSYGGGQVALYRKFAPAGMPRRSLLPVLLDHARFARQLTRVRGKADWARWVNILGYRVGRLEASVRRRTLYL